MTRDKNLYKEHNIADGTVLSEELTAIGKQIKVYLEYAGKIARVTSEQQTMVKTEKPAGLEIFLKAVEDEETRKTRKLKPDEKKVLEKSTRYETKPAKIGNPSHMFNSIFHEITSENKHWQQLIETARKEIEKICTQAGAIEKLQHDDVRDHL